ncbi:MAG: beta-propeller fold lactonase family protein [Verrucomicrobiae bacterium]|nr:beta-propeller fold lactonase family protein [Verrucomicrobiae bacterium]
MKVTWIISLGLLLGAVSETQAQEKDPDPVAVVEVQRYQDYENLESITSTELSPDGKFVYAASFNADTATVWRRDAKTGKVEHVQTFKDPETDGLLALRMSPNGKYLAGASIKNMVTLYSRDETTGKLALLHAIRASENGAGPFHFPIEVRFSNDSRFVYAACSGTLEVFRIEDDRLVGVQSETANDRVSGLRDVDVSPDGTFLYTTGGHTLVVFTRDTETGTVTPTSDMVSSTDDLAALEGVNSICCSPDNRHVYLCSGRFVDHSAVIALERKSNGSLEVIQTWMNPMSGGLFSADVNVQTIPSEVFSGGNEIEVSPDGAEVWALGTESDTVVRFRRDPETGLLKFLGHHLVAGQEPAIGPAGICFSKDGRFAYVADEKEASLVVLERKLSGEE